MDEIFSSFQGEGVLAGVWQVFVRLGGCNLSCTYCDTPRAREKRAECLLDGKGSHAACGNPMSTWKVLECIEERWRPAMHSVSITGGEPLLQCRGLKEILPALRDRGRPVYLETNGTLAGEMAEVSGWVDWVAMDVKLPSSQGGRDLLDRHLDFLRVAGEGNLFMKTVVEEGSGLEEADRMWKALASLSPRCPMVLQPATPVRGVRAPSQSKMAAFYETARRYFREVRVIPQMHKAWRAR